MSQSRLPKLYPQDYLLRSTVIPLIPRWIRPNHITMLRMIMTPFVVWLLWQESYGWGIPLFVFAAFTDALDGSLARVRKQITPWGIFFDPVADKLLVGCVALTVALKYFSPILVFVAIGLDLLPAMMLLGRKVPRNEPVSANLWGKIKMVLQFCALASLLFGVAFHVQGLVVAGEGILGVSLVFALIAAITYSL